MRQVVHEYQGQGLSRRGFLSRMTALGFTGAAAEAILKPVEASERAETKNVPGATTVEGTGGDLVIAQAKAAGTRYLFANPGSMEVGFYDAFADTPDMQLIMGLHEGIVCSMADGYYKATLKPAFMNVHVIAGTAQMAGQLYNAHRDGSPLVITAGLSDNEMWNDDWILAPRPGFDQKDVNRQFTKFSWEARQPESLALMTRRAFKIATTEPGGPVYLALSSEGLEGGPVKAQVLPAERFLIRGRARADEAAIEEAARMLIEADRPVLLAGDEVWKSGAQDALVELSEMLGIGICTIGWQAFANFPSHHPHHLGRFHMRSDFFRGTDLLLSAGAPDFGPRVRPDTPSVPLEAPIIRMGMDTMAMGRTHAIDVALVGDVRETILDLKDAVSSMVTKEKITALARARSDKVTTETKAMLAEYEAEAAANMGKSLMHPDELGVVLSRTIDPDALVVTENLTGRYGAFKFGHRDGELGLVHNSGHGLGWGVGAATGVKLGAPDRQVVLTIGDGSLMYSASGFWTQARYQVPVLTVVWNNHNYQTVRRVYHSYQGKMAKSGHYVGMHLGDPDIDFVQLAQSQGLSAEKVTSAADLEPAIERGIAATRAGSPHLIDVDVACYGGGAESTWHQKFSLADERTRKV